MFFHSTVTPPVRGTTVVSFLAHFWTMNPQNRRRRPRKTNPPTIRRPAMTPPESSVPPLPVLVEVELIPPEVRKSITFCLTHSPKMQSFNCRPEFPNASLMVACRNWQDVVPSEVEHLISTVPLSPFMMLVTLRA